MILGWALAGFLFLVVLECRTRLMDDRAKLPAAVVIEPDDQTATLHEK